MIMLTGIKSKNNKKPAPEVHGPLGADFSPNIDTKM